MYGSRCEDCGEVRWSLFGRPEERPAEECPVCGSTMTLERRHPGHRASGRFDERREAPPVSAA